jgi:cob(I)alamin adenosyltransferase
MQKCAGEKKYVQLYTGDGKGKTTAAIGLAVRAAGHGMKIYVGQFMKGWPYGELAALKNHPSITIEQYGDENCIRKQDVTRLHIDRACAGLEKILTAMLSGAYDIVILDEVNVAVWFGLLTPEQVTDLLTRRPENVEMVLTGRNAPKELIDAADLVTEMRDVKHYYTRGILARDGFER